MRFSLSKVKEVRPLEWKDGCLIILNQLLLPHKIKYFVCRDYKDVCYSIRKMLLRGAPLIGIAAAFAFVLGLKKANLKNKQELILYAKKIKKDLEITRPTAVNLFWATSRIYKYVIKLCRQEEQVDEIIKKLETEAKSIFKADYEKNIRIGENGEKLLKKNSIVMTHCNAGALATSGHGTALGIIRTAYKKGKIKKVYVNETRPYLQGARLTMFELMNEKIPCELITDNMAGYIMKTKRIDAVIVGADRIAKNGDVANKIGTYQLAILANHHKIPFYVAAPTSTIDYNIASGDEIPIEERSEEEVKKIFNRYITLKNAKALHPAFDVTPSNLITAIITEEGIFRYPYEFSARFYTSGSHKTL